MSRAGEYLEEFNERPFEHRVIIVLLVAFLVSFALVILVSIMESLWLRRPETNIKQLSAPLSVKKAAPKPEVHPIDLLPQDISGAKTKMRQRMPGASSYAGEAIYTPADEFEFIRNPFSVYVNVTYYLSGRTAADVIDQRLSKNAINPTEVAIGRQKALAGLNQKKDTYTIGWFDGAYGFEIDATFARRVPGEIEPMIEFAHKVADQLEKSASASREAIRGR